LTCRVAFEQFRHRRLEVVIDRDNFASRLVALRNGFRETGSREDRLLYVNELESVSRSE